MLPWLLALTMLTATDCNAQFAPLMTGTYSGASRVPFWRKAEAGNWGGEGWLGWTRNGNALQSVRLIVRDRPKDEGHDEPLVTVESVPPVAFAIRCVLALRARAIQRASVTGTSLLRDRLLKLALGRRRYELRLDSAREDLTDAKVILSDGRVTQVLYSADGFADDPHFDVEWIGDLDGDGKLDLVVNLSRKYSAYPYRLLLSTRATRGQLVGDAAVFETAD